GPAELFTDTLSTIRALPLPKARAEKLTTRLLQISSDGRVSKGLRLNILAAVPGGLPEVPPSTFDFLRGQLDPEQAAATRTLAADVLAKAKLTPDQLVTLTESVKAAGPLELDRLLDAFASSTDERVGKSLIAALMASPARSSLRIDVLRPRFARCGAAVQKQA